MWETKRLGNTGIEHKKFTVWNFEVPIWSCMLENTLNPKWLTGTHFSSKLFALTQQWKQSVTVSNKALNHPYDNIPSIWIISATLLIFSLTSKLTFLPWESAAWLDTCVWKWVRSELMQTPVHKISFLSDCLSGKVAVAGNYINYRV